MMVAGDTLDDLTAAAANADGANRIEFRDRIAAFGVAGIQAMAPWLGDPRLGGFAVRTIERAVTDEASAETARQVLATAAATGAVGDDIDAALARLGGRRVDGGRFDLRREPIRNPDPNLVRRFDADMFEVYESAKREAGYVAVRFLQKYRRVGGLTTAHDLLTQPGVSKGFLALKKSGMLDLSVEYLVLRPEYSVLFSNEELGVARQRLLAHGFPPARLPASR